MFAGYSHPYVISFSDRAIDVFDSSTAEWLQTIPLKKVRFKYWSRVVFLYFYTDILVNSRFLCERCKQISSHCNEEQKNGKCSHCFTRLAKKTVNLS